MPEGVMSMILSFLKMAVKALSKYAIDWITELASLIAGIDLQVLLLGT